MKLINDQNADAKKQIVRELKEDNAKNSLETQQIFSRLDSLDKRMDQLSGNIAEILGMLKKP